MTMSDISLSNFTQEAYRDYALYVLHDRALPRLIDGLKPVQRRLVYAMSQLHLDYKAKPKKSARTVGDVLGKFHPHSDQACYEALVNLSQDFTTRYPLLWGQGNFGSLDDPKSFAAMRYTEVKLSLYANLLLEELNDEVVPWQSNFDGTLKEPLHLPAQLPILLANGCSGIAVGMSCEIPPFNIGEIIQALLLLLKAPQSSTQSLVEVLPGPDFPTGGLLKSSSESMAQFYESSQGSFIIEGLFEHQGKKITITQLPYMVNTSRLIEQIQQLAQKKILTGLSDLIDMSDHEQPVCLECHFKSVQDATKGIACLLEKTDLRRTYRAYFNILDENNIPGSLSLKEFLTRWLKCRQDIVLKQYQRRLRLIKERLHILNALFCIYLDLEAVIGIIRYDDNPWQTLAQRYDLDQVQIDALKQLRLSQLTKLNHEQLSGEKEALEQESIETFSVISSATKLKNTIAKQLRSLAKVYADLRRTKIVREDFEQIAPEMIVSLSPQVVKEYPLKIMITQMGWAKALKAESHLNIDWQSSLRASDSIIAELSAISTQDIILFDDKGRLYSLPAHTIVSSRFGEHIANTISLPSGHQIVHMSHKAQVIIITSDLLTMKLDLEKLELSSRGAKVIDLNPGQELSFVVPLDAPYVMLHTEQSLGVIAVDDIPWRRKGKGVALISKQSTPIQKAYCVRETVRVAWKKPRHKTVEKSFVDLLIKRSGKLKKIPEKLQDIIPDIKS